MHDLLDTEITARQYAVMLQAICWYTRVMSGAISLPSWDLCVERFCSCLENFSEKVKRGRSIIICRWSRAQWLWNSTCAATVSRNSEAKSTVFTNRKQCRSVQMAEQGEGDWSPYAHLKYWKTYPPTCTWNFSYTSKNTCVHMNACTHTHTGTDGLSHTITLTISTGNNCCGKSKLLHGWVAQTWWAIMKNSIEDFPMWYNKHHHLFSKAHKKS